MEAGHQMRGRGTERKEVGGNEQGSEAGTVHCWMENWQSELGNNSGQNECWVDSSRSSLQALKSFSPTMTCGNWCTSSPMRRPQWLVVAWLQQLRCHIRLLLQRAHSYNRFFHLLFVACQFTCLSESINLIKSDYILNDVLQTLKTDLKHPIL